MPTLINQWLAHPMAEALAIALVSFVWQGAVMALVVATGLFLARRASANVRYALACVGLAAMAVAPIVTAAGAFAGPQTVALGSSPLTGEVPTVAGTFVVTDVNGVSEPAPNLSYDVSLSGWFMSVLVFWMAGVTFLSVRLTRGWTYVVRLRRSTGALDHGSVLAVLTRLASRLGLSRRVALLESALLDTPTVIGWIKPAILFPAGALTGLSPFQLEAVLAHELAHIRRHDYAVNVLQHVVETLLFYHPAVWWVSNRIRVEREHSCDELAVDLCGDRIAYARTLASLEEARQRHAAFGMAATGGDLVGRVKRLLNPVPAAPKPSAAFAIVLVAVALVSVVLVQGQSGQPAAARRPVVLPVPAPTAVPPADLELPTAVEVPMPVAAPDALPSFPVPSIGVGGVNALPNPGLSLPVAIPDQQSSTSGMHRPVVSESITIQAAPVGGPPVELATEVRPEPLPLAGSTSANAVPQRRVYVPPRYPEAARSSGLGGVVHLIGTIDSAGDVSDLSALPVVLTATIGADGQVSDLRTLPAPAPSLTDAAIEAVRQWKYSPARQDGSPVPVRISVTINFVAPPKPAAPASSTALPPQAQIGYSYVVTPTGGYSQIQTTQLPVRIGGAISAPRRLTYVEPIMPAIARAARMSGIVFLEITLSRAGRVVDIKVARSAGVLDQAAIDAVRQWEYEPVLLNGQPVELIMTVAVSLSWT